MKKKLFIGIDFSKKTLDVSVVQHEQLDIFTHSRFENSKEGFAALLQWVKQQSRLPQQEWLFCGEHTGLYSLQLSEFLIKKGLFMWLENPLQIKQSAGIRRDKNDKVDSRDIALYACRFIDKAKAYKLPDKSLKALEMLLSFRERIVRNKQTILVSANEIRRVKQRDATARYIYEQSKKDIERMNKEIKNIEQKMLELIQANEDLKENYKIVSSVKGIALINTATILVATQNFTRFENARQFACYAGMAPFGKQTGTSMKTNPRVSHLAAKHIKVLLTQAATAAILHDPNIRRYYQRKLEEGKNAWLIKNNVRNKLIHCVFALVKSRQLYQPDYRHPLDKVA